MKELLLSAMLSAYGVCTPYTIENERTPINDRESWCSCVISSDQTDMSLSECDNKYGKRFNFDFERDCECKDIPYSDEERIDYASPWIDSIWKENKE